MGEQETERDGGEPGFLTIEEVMGRTTLSRSTIYRAIEAGTFPKPIKLEGTRSVWVEGEIIAWKRKRVEDART